MHFLPVLHSHLEPTMFIIEKLDQHTEAMHYSANISPCCFYLFIYIDTNVNLPSLPYAESRSMPHWADESSWHFPSWLNTVSLCCWGTSPVSDRAKDWRRVAGRKRGVRTENDRGEIWHRKEGRTECQDVAQQPLVFPTGRIIIQGKTHQPSNTLSSQDTA